MNRRLELILAGLATTALLAHPALGAAFTFGDVFASVGGGLVREYTPTGTLVQTLNTNTSSTYTAGSAIDPAGNFYVTTFDTGIVSKFGTGLTSGVNFASVGGDEESIAIGKLNDFFVGEADGGGQISKRSLTDGSLIQNYTAGTQGRGTDWLDLAGDQTTLYYTSEGSNIERYSTIGSGSQLANFETGKGATLYALRILANGGVLVANTGNVLQFDSSGNIVRTYTIPGSSTLFALNLDPDGATFWTGDLSTNEITRINIATGAIINQFNTGTGTLAGLSIFGEITQGGGGGGGTTPEPATFLLLGTSLAALGFTYRRKAGR